MVIDFLLRTPEVSGEDSIDLAHSGASLFLAASSESNLSKSRASSTRSSYWSS